MRTSELNGLSRRERQIMDIVYREERVSAADVLAEMPDPPTYSAVRALLRILEMKGHLRHEKDGVRYVYQAVQRRESAAHRAIQHVLSTFFGGSVERVVAALLSDKDAEFGDDELARLEAMIARAKAEKQL